MNDYLKNRHIGISADDEAVMLGKVGVKNLDELIKQTIPSNILISTIFFQAVNK